jgi:hypothetical protein
MDESFQAPLPVCWRFLIFWDVTQRRSIVIYWSFGKIYWSLLQGSKTAGPLLMGLIGCPEMSVTTPISTRNSEDLDSYQLCNWAVAEIKAVLLITMEFFTKLILHFVCGNSVLWDSDQCNFLNRCTVSLKGAVKCISHKPFSILLHARSVLWDSDQCNFLNRYTVSLKGAVKWISHKPFSILLHARSKNIPVN